MNLVLERRSQQDESTISPTLAMTPPLDEDYWSYRVRVSDTQAVLGFPKFFTIGIGFAVEAEDWNVNLPYTSDAWDIAEHIRINRGDAKMKDVRAAIRLIQVAVQEDKSADYRNQAAELIEQAARYSDEAAKLIEAADKETGRIQ